MNFRNQNNPLSFIWSWLKIRKIAHFLIFAETGWGFCTDDGKHGEIDDDDDDGDADDNDDDDGDYKHGIINSPCYHGQLKKMKLLWPKNVAALIWNMTDGSVNCSLLSGSGLNLELSLKGDDRWRNALFPLSSTAMILFSSLGIFMKIMWMILSSLILMRGWGWGIQLVMP